MGIIGYFVYPLLMELAMNTWAKYMFNEKTSFIELRNKEKLMKKKHPIIYHEKYNIKAFGIEKMHPFDTCRPGKICKLLKEKKIIF